MAGKAGKSGGARPGSGPARQRVTLTQEIADELRKRQGDAYSGEAQEALVNRIVLEWLALSKSEVLP
jgi:hypothetical protein